MLKGLKVLSIDFILEFVIFVVVSLCHLLLFTEGSGIRADDLLFGLELWIAVVLYRTLYLQLPIAWIFTLFRFRSDGWCLRKVIAIINGSTFIGVIIIASFLSVVVAGVFSRDFVHIPIIALFATVLSPLINPIKGSKVQRNGKPR